MDYVYALTPFLAWLAAGVTKFAINSIRHRQMAFKLIGYGGLPSNHSAIVSSTAALIALKEGVQHPAFGVAVTLAFVVMLDAHSLRKQVGLQASAINDLNKDTNLKQPLRERMGHSLLEIVAGAVTGVVVAWSAHAWLI